MFWKCSDVHSLSLLEDPHLDIIITSEKDLLVKETQTQQKKLFFIGKMKLEKHFWKHIRCTIYAKRGIDKEISKVIILLLLVCHTVNPQLSIMTEPLLVTSPTDVCLFSICGFGRRMGCGPPHQRGWQTASRSHMLWHMSFTHRLLPTPPHTLSAG